MAGWSKIDDGSDVDCAKTPKSFNPDGFFVQLNLARPEEGRGFERQPVGETGIDTEKYRSCFERLVGHFLKEISSDEIYRSIPPMLGEERDVDLFKLFLVVREKGGYEAVSRNGLWDLVAEESGLGLVVSPAVKLVYCKYLQVLERWLVRAAENRNLEDSLRIGGAGLMDLEAEFKGFLSEISDLKKKDEEYSLMDGTVNSPSVVVESCGGKECVDDSGSLPGVGKLPCDNEVKSVVVEQNGGKKENEATATATDDDDDVLISDLSVVDEGSFSSKRKRESLMGMLNWVNGVAKDPCDPVIGSLPERSKWNSYANDELWKQILLAREALFLKRNADSSAEESILQKSQKMHPSMYDDNLASSYNLRERLKCRRKLLSGETLSEARTCSEPSSAATQSDLDNSPSSGTAGTDCVHVLDTPLRQRTPVGPNYQVEVPEWTGVAFESDSKWLGTTVWPLERKENRFLIERDPMGKGRQDSCGCQVPGSFECVKFHIAEKRFKVKLELGSAFHHWRFDGMGEEVALSWQKVEEKKFDSIVRSNPPSLGKCFWDQLYKSFPAKSREILVSYYFNVFLLRRRGFQNRYTPVDVNSDDDESDSGSNYSEHETAKKPGSILYSPNKPHKKFR